MRNRKLFVAVSAGLLALTFAAGSALADPSGPPTFRALAGVGSDTTQDVMNGMSNVVVDGTGTKLIGSYDAVGSAQITTKDPATNPNCTINRPVGSNNGINALITSLQAGNGCLQFARSSSNSASSFPGANLTYVPFAVDAVAYGIRSDSAITKKLTLAQLTTVYNCAAGANFQPLLPQFGSGTRQFFLRSMGFTDSADFVTLPGHTCIKDTDATGGPIIENVGTFLTDPRNIAPYSIAQYISQINGVVSDVHGKVVLGSLDSISPVTLNISSTMKRDVYNVIPTGQLGNAPYSTTFVGPTSAICQSTATIIQFGFGTNPACGDTSIHTP